MGREAGVGYLTVIKNALRCCLPFRFLLDLAVGTKGECKTDSDCGEGQVCSNPGLSSAKCGELVVVVGEIGVRC